MTLALVAAWWLTGYLLSRAEFRHIDRKYGPPDAAQRNRAEKIIVSAYCGIFGPVMILVMGVNRLIDRAVDH